MKIAVVGSGISGLSATYYLSKKHKVDLFEKENQFGGHANTIKVIYDNKKEVAVDIGFMVFNQKTYPHLINFFSENKIDIEKSDMSFSVSASGNNLEYCGKGISGIFSNKKNLFNPKFIKMFFEIISFYKKCEKLEIKKENPTTLGEYLKEIKISNYFINYHIIPMVSAIWSMPPYEASQMPLTFFLNFFKNHGLFRIKNRPQWYTVTGRSKVYVKKVLKSISGEYFKNYEVKSVNRSIKNVRLYYGTSNEYFDYDKVIFATHADQTLNLIKNPTRDERNILSNFKYKKNIAYLHKDESLMPNNKKAWSSWNSILDNKDNSKNCVTYWLNKLQNLKTKNNYFLTLNPFTPIEKKYIIKIVDFTHPFYDLKSIEAQKNLVKLQGKNNSWFCGSYFGYGFHEDGLKSSINIVNQI